ncbi:hypothetical protein [Streptomyces bohaiensis]|uniref:DivIVA domain-containing protein n=1 Tax=Streptomyces bohaiensis TaxID=1431344 RepID=A0ABX1CIR4_9ACTN|nr:hypothetical protein [Streptomyces bohaiensis]NJQ17352.1 hypothetical protein [Streptomyces bohaiensis]
MAADRPDPTAVPFFSGSWRGYDRREVDRYLAEQDAELTGRARQIADRNREIDRLRGQVAALNARLTEAHTERPGEVGSDVDGLELRVERLLETAAGEAARSPSPEAAFRRALAEAEAAIAHGRSRHEPRAERLRESAAILDRAAALVDRARAEHLPGDR